MSSKQAPTNVLKGELLSSEKIFFDSSVALMVEMNIDASPTSGKLKITSKALHLTVNTKKGVKTWRIPIENIKATFRRKMLRHVRGVEIFYFSNEPAGAEFNTNSIEHDFPTCSVSTLQNLNAENTEETFPQELDERGVEDPMYVIFRANSFCVFFDGNIYQLATAITAARQAKAQATAATTTTSSTKKLEEQKRRTSWIFQSLKEEKQCLKEYTDKWASGEISNFEYLILLNVVFGARSFKQLNQYPIFPSILKNFTNEELRLSDESVYRNLSQNIAATTPGGEAQLLDKFKRNGSHFDAPPSNLRTTLFYLARLEHYSDIFLLKNRSFEAVGCAIGNITQLASRELVPEVFYNSDILTNKHEYPLPESISEVKLPAWAANRHQFTRTMRAALEDIVVSRMLPQWIDLVFGFKHDSAADLNVYPAWSYENAPVKREDDLQLPFIVAANGVLPSQLFSTQHTQKLKQWKLTKKLFSVKQIKLCDLIIVVNN